MGGARAPRKEDAPARQRSTRPCLVVGYDGSPEARAAVAYAAARHRADEIVIGSRGSGRVRAALGSVSHEVLHRADRPVVVVPHGALGQDGDE